MKTLFNCRLGNSAWSLSLGEYLFLVVAVLGGWFAGCVTSRQPVLARSAPMYQVTDGTNGMKIIAGADRGRATE